MGNACGEIPFDLRLAPRGLNGIVITQAELEELERRLAEEEREEELKDLRARQPHQGRSKSPFPL